MDPRFAATLLILAALVGCEAAEPPAEPPPANLQPTLSQESAPPAPEPEPDFAADPAQTAPSAPATPWSPSGYRLIGTEPFWGGTVTADEIVYSTPEDQQGSPISVTAAYSATVEVYSGRFQGNPFILTLTSGPCSDGMSDNVHRFTATLEVQGETRRGCANPR